VNDQNGGSPLFPSDLVFLGLAPTSLPRLRKRMALVGISVLTRISHQLSTAVPDPGMPTALRSVGFLDVLSSTPAVPAVARLVSVPVCVTSLQNLVRKAG